jgi:hypothetical protein
VNNNFTVLRNAIVALEQPVGVSRLAVGGDIADGKVLKAQGGNLVWGDDQTGGAAFGASLTGTAAGDAEGSTGVGFKVRNDGVLGTAVRGEVATVGWGVRGVAGGSGIGVQGEAAGAGGIGVQGKAAAGSIGVRGEVPTTGWGVRGVAGGAGIGVQGDAGANGIGVRGEVPTTGQGVLGVAGGAGIGVQGEAGTGGAGVLAKSNEGTALLVEGSIGVRGSRPAAFVHTSDAGNISGNVTVIDNPLTNNDPNAILIVTLRSGAVNPLGTSPIGVWYSGSNRWTIFRADGANMPTGVQFNVLVIKQVP